MTLHTGSLQANDTIPWIKYDYLYRNTKSPLPLDKPFYLELKRRIGWGDISAVSLSKYRSVDLEKELIFDNADSDKENDRILVMPYYESDYKIFVFRAFPQNKLDRLFALARYVRGSRALLTATDVYDFWNYYTYLQGEVVDVTGFSEAYIQDYGTPIAEIYKAYLNDRVDLIHDILSEYLAADLADRKRTLVLLRPSVHVGKPFPLAANSALLNALEQYDQMKEPEYNELESLVSQYYIPSAEYVITEILITAGFMELPATSQAHVNLVSGLISSPVDIELINSLRTRGVNDLAAILDGRLKIFSPDVGSTMSEIQSNLEENAKQVLKALDTLRGDRERQINARVLPAQYQQAVSDLARNLLCA